MCKENSGVAPWRIFIFRSPLGDKEHERDPLYFSLVAFAYLPANQNYPRSQSGVTLEVTKARSQNREDWFLETGKRRWLAVKRPAHASAESTVWYDRPFQIDAKVKHQDAVEVLDLLFLTTSRQQPFEAVVKDPKSGRHVRVEGSPPDISELKDPILRMEIGSSSTEPGELLVEIGVWGKATWEFVIFKKQGKKWKLKDMGWGITRQSPRTGKTPS